LRDFDPDALPFVLDPDCEMIDVLYTLLLLVIRTSFNGNEQRLCCTSYRSLASCLPILESDQLLCLLVPKINELMEKYRLNSMRTNIFNRAGFPGGSGL
jgi:hypothetical protein